MIYRKAPPQPTRLLLRIVAGAGAGALLGASACGGDDSNHHVNGVVVMPSSGDDSNHHVNGLVVMPSSGSTVGGGVITGVTTGVPSGGSPDAGKDAEKPVSPAPPDDSGAEAATVGGGVSPCHPCGVVIMPHDAGADATSHPIGVVPFNDGGFPGIMIMPVGVLPAPDDSGRE